MISAMANMGFVAQVKKNGTCSEIAVSPTKKLVTMNRHNEEHRAWSPTPASSAAFKALPGNGWYVILAELMHSKVPGIRDTNYIFDILVANGEYLIGTTFEERQKILYGLFYREGMEATRSHYVVDSNTWLARVYTKGLPKLFDLLTEDQDAGIVLKNPKAVLEPCSRPNSNSSWALKVRRGTKNYGF
jgi:hypothetical protein